jgi:hypothetical protein
MRLPQTIRSLSGVHAILGRPVTEETDRRSRLEVPIFGNPPEEIAWLVKD